MKKSQIILSVVIVTYKSKSHIYNCIESINKHNDLGNKIEVIVIDNTSFLESKTIKQKISNKYSFSTIVEYSGGNVGYGKANNIGVELAKGKYICILNADTIFIEKIFNRAISKFSNTSVRTLGVKLLNEKLESELSFFYIRGYLSSFSSFIVKKLNSLNYKLDCMITTGACMFVRTQDFKQVGGFNPDMFLFHEESYLSRRFLGCFKHNIFYFDKSLRLVHLEKAAKANKSLSLEYYKSMATYYKFFNFNIKLILMIFYVKQTLRKLFGFAGNSISKNEYNHFKHFTNKIQ